MSETVFNVLIEGELEPFAIRSTEPDTAALCEHCGLPIADQPHYVTNADTSTDPTGYYSHVSCALEPFTTTVDLNDL